MLNEFYVFYDDHVTICLHVRVMKLLIFDCWSIILEEFIYCVIRDVTTEKIQHKLSMIFEWFKNKKRGKKL